MSTARFHPLAPIGEALISAYVGSGQHIFTAPPLGSEAGAARMRPFSLCFDVEKSTDIDSSDYLKLEKSPDDGVTWMKVQAAYDDSDAANFLDGKTGETSAAFESVVWLAPLQKVRLLANAGLTLNKVGFSY